MEDLQTREQTGRFLTQQDREAIAGRREKALRHRRWKHRLRIAALLAADGVLV